MIDAGLLGVFVVLLLAVCWVCNAPVASAAVGGQDASQSPAVAEESMVLASGYFLQGNYAKAFPLAQNAADRGNAKAQGLMGAMYMGGLGVDKNAKEAAKWLRKAADQGDSSAMYGVASLYLDGNGVPRDDAEGMMWMQKAADKGCIMARCSLGMLYAEGRGVKRDVAAAISNFEKAAECGDYRAQRGLGAIYKDGVGVPRDHTKAFKWLREAALAGDAESQSVVGGFCLAGKVTSQDTIEGCKWIMLAAQQGHKASVDLVSSGKLSSLLSASEMENAKHRVSVFTPRLPSGPPENFSGYLTPLQRRALAAFVSAEMKDMRKVDQVREPVPKSERKSGWKDLRHWRDRLKKGMTKDEVRETLGEPDHITSISGDEWSYGESPYGGRVYFYSSGKVLGWSEPHFKNKGE